ncbi:hypothetical protein M0P25_04355 [archaeon]|nr:hypothetical protein [archaeon]
MAETSSWRNTMEKKQNTKMQLEPYIDDISYDHVEISGDDKDGSENISIEAIIEGLSGDDVYLIAEGDCKYSTTPYIAATRWDPPEGGELILEDIWCNELWLETIYHTNEPNILKTHFNENETGFSNKDFNHMCDVFIYHLTDVGEDNTKLNVYDIPLNIPSQLTNKILEIINSDKFQADLMKAGESHQYAWNKIDPILINKDKYTGARRVSKLKGGF